MIRRLRLLALSSHPGPTATVTVLAAGLAVALGYASRGAPKDRLDRGNPVRIALADGIAHCLCGMRVRRRGGR